MFLILFITSTITVTFIITLIVNSTNKIDELVNLIKEDYYYLILPFIPFVTGGFLYFTSKIKIIITKENISVVNKKKNILVNWKDIQKIENGSDWIEIFYFDNSIYINVNHLILMDDKKRIEKYTTQILDFINPLVPQ